VELVFSMAELDSLVLLKNNKENYYLTVKNKLDGKEMFI
jgi:hypothetical protein